jgi:hypothetical protein
LRAFVLGSSYSAGNADSIMENDFWFYVAVIGGGMLSIALMVVALFHP